MAELTIDDIRDDLADTTIRVQDRPIVERSELHDWLWKHYPTGFPPIESVSDHPGCYRIHTSALAIVAKATRKRFATDSQSTTDTKHNGYVFLNADGSVTAFKYGNALESTWSVSVDGHYYCVVGRTPTPRESCLAAGLTPAKAKGTFRGSTRDQIEAVAADYDLTLDLPEVAQDRAYTVSVVSGGLLISVEKLEDDGQWPKWAKVKGQGWQRFFAVELLEAPQPDLTQVDAVTRAVEKDGTVTRLLYRGADGAWLTAKNIWTVDRALMARGIDTPHVWTGQAMLTPYKFAAEPNNPLWPGGRKCNLGGAQLLHKPAANPRPTPTWQLITDDLGLGLWEAIEADTPEGQWCREHGITTGGHYIRAHYAIALKHPRLRLPCLALYSKQNKTGKTPLWKSLTTLIDERGWVDGSKALRNKGGFDFEVAGKTVVALEECDFASNEAWYATLKKWVTDSRILITQKGEDSITLDNYMHVYLTTNVLRYIPIDAADRRITLWEKYLFAGPEIPESILYQRLYDEGADFLGQLWPIADELAADPFDRFVIPVLSTQEREAVVGDGPTLDGLSLQLHDTIATKIKKQPWKGTAAALSALVGDWGYKGKSPDRSLGHRMPTLARESKELAIVIDHDGKNTVYTITKR